MNLFLKFIEIFSALFYNRTYVQISILDIKTDFKEGNKYGFDIFQKQPINHYFQNCKFYFQLISNNQITFNELSLALPSSIYFSN